MNGTQITRKGDAIFVPLPPNQWRNAGTCSCGKCGGVAWWDTLAIPVKPEAGRPDTAFTVHYPELHSDYAATSDRLLADKETSNG